MHNSNDFNVLSLILTVNAAMYCKCKMMDYHLHITFFAIHYIMQVVAAPPPHEDLSLRNKKWHDGKISLSA